MADSGTGTRINEVGTVFIPVADQDRALSFYVDVLGFQKRADFVYGAGSRWIEVAPAGAKNTIALVPASEGESAGSDEARCAFSTEDIEADHAMLRAHGVPVDTAIASAGSNRPGLVSLDVTIPDPIPAQFFFRDPDGNRFLIVSPG
ncbi:MAG: VOC family protein [Solirubrobacteraceae bacterium]